MMNDQELIDHAKRLLDNTSGNEPWDVYHIDDGPDTFDGYRIWHDDGKPGILFICKGFEQGADDGKGDAEFVAAAPYLVRALVKALESRMKCPHGHGINEGPCAVCDAPTPAECACNINESNPMRHREDCPFATIW